jgi:hypothetical protein
VVDSSDTLAMWHTVDIGDGGCVAKNSNSSVGTSSIGGGGII